MKYKTYNDIKGYIECNRKEIKVKNNYLLEKKE